MQDGVKLENSTSEAMPLCRIKYEREMSFLKCTYLDFHLNHNIYFRNKNKDNRQNVERDYIARYVYS